MRVRDIMTCAAVVAAVPTVSVAGDKPEGVRAVLVEEVRNEEAPFMVRVDVDQADRLYRIDETMTVTVMSEKPGYLYLLYLQADDKVALLFPNRFQKENHIPAVKQVTIPKRGARFRLRIGEPTGEEVLKAIVSERPLDKIDIEEARKRIATPVKEATVRAVYVEDLKDRKPTWAEHEVQIKTVPRGTDDSQTQRPTRRIAVCIGISQYQDDKIRDLHICHQDATTFAQMLRRHCGFDEVIVLSNERATRSRIETTIRQRLAQSTRPGDEVFIYWSGHGARTADTSGDEDDGLDELLIPHDADTTNVETIKKTVISDDAFGRWLQDLDGRKVLVVLDTCHSGGQSNHEKGVRVPGLGQTKSIAASELDFFDGELSRAKDIGQRNVALLASSKARQISFERREGDLSVMTYFIVQQLAGTSSTVTLTGLYESLKSDVANYVEERFDGAPQTPVLVNDIESPFYVKRD